jgi:uncharacterized protein YcaQ
METLSLRDARRLALARAGLWKPEWTGLPSKAGRRPLDAAQAIIERFGYLQLDTISVAGARSHGIVLASRLDGFDTALAETLLRPGCPLFEFWGHEACWLPLDLYPLLAFRRQANRGNRWWVLTQHPKMAQEMLERVRQEGPLKSVDFGGGGGKVWWDRGVAKDVAASLWAIGALAVRERTNFQRVYDLPERVIPDEVRRRHVLLPEAIRHLVLLSLDGHGFAGLQTIVDTFRLRAHRSEVIRALGDLIDSGEVLRCEVEGQQGFVRPRDLDLAPRLSRARPRLDRGVLLSPFDPLLWDRQRLKAFFDFDYRIEIYTPAAKRVYGYYTLPVLAGDRLVARVDLKARRKQGVIEVLSIHYQADPPPAADRAAVESALDRYGRSVGLDFVTA